MRKVKHFAGYGTVSMGRVNDGAARLHVKVEGNHERGLSMGTWDEYGLWRWIVHRFLRDMTYEQWHQLRPVVDVVDTFREDPATGYVDVCHYYFNY